MTVESMSGCLYYLIFIDDYSRKTWIFPLKTKGEVFSKFREFKAQVENLSGRKIKTLRSDNGGEYTSGDFTDFCKEAGIKREYTVQASIERSCGKEEQSDTGGHESND